MKPLARLVKSIVPYRNWVLIASAAMMFGVAFDLISPLLLQWTIDIGIGNADIQAIVLFTSLLALGQLIKSGAMFLQGYAQERVGQSVIYDLRAQLYRHLQHLPFSYYDRAKTGQIMARMTGDIDAVKNFVSFAAMNLVMGVLMFAGTVAFMAVLQWQVTLICMTVIPLLIHILWRFNKKVGPAWAEIREQMGRLTTTLQENISGIRVVKAFAREQLEKTKFGVRNEKNYDVNMERAKLEANAFPLMSLYGGLVFLLMNWVGGIYVVRGEMSIGTLIAFQWYVWGLIWPLNMMGWLVNIMQQALRAAPRVYEILDTPIDIASPPDGGKSAEGIRGHVEFRDVRFRFPEAASGAGSGTDGTAADSDRTGRDVLSDIRLTVRPGEAVAVLGATGSGKSTLIHLLARSYDPTEGAILIDGVDLREYNLTELRRKIGFVPQETFLFSATIRENIAFGDPGASQERIEWAARKAHIHDFIASLPDGYDTVVGERGVGLSGGQRQRVALARAILTDPPILVLDEATASVDTATEAAIHEALHEVMQGRTTFIVAQRLSTIQRADRIIVLEDGRIAEQGTHRELMERDGFFRRLFRMQETAAGDDPMPLIGTVKAGEQT